MIDTLFDYGWRVNGVGAYEKYMRPGVRAEIARDGTAWDLALITNGVRTLLRGPVSAGWVLDNIHHVEAVLCK